MNDSSDENIDYDYDQVDSSASGSSAYGMGALNRICDSKIKSIMKQNDNKYYQDNPDDMGYLKSYQEQIDTSSLDYANEAMIQDKIINSLTKITPITRINSEEAIQNVKGMKKRLESQHSSTKNSPSRGRVEHQQFYTGNSPSRGRLEHLPSSTENSLSRESIKRKLSNDKILKNIDDAEIVGFSNKLSAKNVKKIGDGNKIKRSRSTTTASSITTMESVSSRNTPNSRNTPSSSSSSGSTSTSRSSLMSSLPSRKSVNLLNFDNMKEVRRDIIAPVAVRNSYSQYIDLENDEEIMDDEEIMNDT